MTFEEINNYVQETYGDNFYIKSRLDGQRFALFDDDSPFKFPDTFFDCELASLKDAIDEYFK